MVSELGEFIERLHPDVQDVIAQSLRLTFVEMIKSHRDERVELDEIASLHTEFSSW